MVFIKYDEEGKKDEEDENWMREKLIIEKKVKIE